MTSKEKAKKLLEIADALEEWGKYNEKVTNWAEWDTPEAKQIIRKAMTLLVDNLGLLNECKNKYGCHSPLKQCFEAIEQVASLPKTKDLGDYHGWTSDFTERHLWGGEKRSLADECVRYAEELDRIADEETTVGKGNKEEKSLKDVSLENGKGWIAAFMKFLKDIKGYSLINAVEIHGEMGSTDSVYDVLVMDDTSDRYLALIGFCLDDNPTSLELAWRDLIKSGWDHGARLDSGYIVCPARRNVRHLFDIYLFSENLEPEFVTVEDFPDYEELRKKVDTKTEASVGEDDGKKVVQEVFDTDEDVKVAFEKYLKEEKGYAPENYSTEQYGDEYAVTRIWDNERKVLALMAFCLERSGADKAFEGIMEYKKNKGISGVPNYVIFANEVKEKLFAMLEYEDGGDTNELPYWYFPTFEVAKFVWGLSSFCSILTRMVLGRTESLDLNIEVSGDGSYINLRRGTKNVAVQIHKYGISQDTIGLALAGYSKEYPGPKSEHIEFGEITELSGHRSGIGGERSWLNGNMGRQICPARVYVVDSMERLDFSVLKEVLEEVMSLVGLAKEKMLDVIGDEGEYHAPIAAYSGDGVRDDEGRLVDQLGIEPEVNAMSSLIAARDIKWPLSIGLFGDWGSGKSFFMEMMYDRIKKTSEESRKWVGAGNESAYCTNVVQIRFNAWHYMDANLWASLVTHIFEELARQMSGDKEEDLARTKEKLFGQLESAKELKKEAQEKKRKAAELRKEAEDKLGKAEKERADAAQELANLTGRDVVALAKEDPRIREEFAKIADTLGLDKIAPAADDLREVVSQGRDLFGRVSLIWRTISSRRKGKIKLLGVIGLILGLPVLVGLVVRWFSNSAFAAQLTGVIGVIVSVITGHMTALKPRLARINKGLAQWEKTQEEILTISAEKTQQRNEEELRIRREIENLKERERAAEADVERAEGLEDEASEELEEIKTGRRLFRFIEERSRKSEYKEKLGIIALIREDFELLSKLVSKSSKEAAGDDLPRVDRIVLYIDDLDRCPSERVVEVLQAVHLILAFELFVVVVAVDSRWILHALHEEYSAFGGVDRVTARLGSRWLTTPQNYVEKIFQIPFALRPMGDRGYRQLVGRLVESEGHKDGEVMAREGREEQELEREIPQGEEKEIQMEETGDRVEGEKDGVDEFEPTIEMKPPSANLSEQEAEFMKAMGDLIPSPRAAKRFVNIYRLTLASVDDRGKLSELRGTENRPGDYQAVLLMLAILTGFPVQGADILKTLANGGGKCNGILDFVRKLKTGKERNSDPARYRNVVRKGILEAERAVWDRLSNILKERIEELRVRDSLEPFVRWASWVARFSFQYKPVISEEEGDEEDG